MGTVVSFGTLRHTVTHTHGVAGINGFIGRVILIFFKNLNYVFPQCISLFFSLITLCHCVTQPNMAVRDRMYIFALTFTTTTSTCTVSKLITVLFCRCFQSQIQR